IGTLVSGVVAQDGDRLRVKVSFIDALDGRNIHEATLERPRSDVFQLQDDLAKETSVILRQQLGQQVEDIDSRRGTRNVQAWEGLQRARLTVAGVDSILATGNVQGAAQRLAVADSEVALVEGMDKKWTAPIV